MREIDFRMGVIWVEGIDDRIAEWQWKSEPDGGENTSVFNVNKPRIDGLNIAVTGDQIKKEVVKLTRRY